ncbi:MAG TPA: hypothetical protein VK501_25825 [Baekduia sp.]|uniref:hypothetical protein n=1 Tax=Baekduia sp. TaxID=2600305 RepID=UPI002B741BCD|nr:hypothetical protein [Baekduia sp.]HMJ37350.1 hypothetical protein [Baekduia sp.]
MPLRHPRHVPAVLILLLVAAAAALTAAPAGAKGLTGVSVCGADGCTSHSGDPGSLAPLLDGGALVADPGRAPFVRIKEHLGDGGKTFGTSTLIYVPRWGLWRNEEGSWLRPYPDAATLLRRLTRDVRPLPAKALKPHKTSGPPVPEARPWVAPAPAAAVAGLGDDGGPSGVLLAAAGAAVALALTAVALWRRRHGASGRPAIG